MDKRVTSPNSEHQNAGKTRRISRACLQCRTRKQRCLPSSETAGPQVPCKRCTQHTITCSFEIDPIPGPDVSLSPSKMAQLVVELQQRVNNQESRLLELEGRPQPTQTSEFRGDVQMEVLPTGTAHESPRAVTTTVISPSATFSMDAVNLGAPIATLRSLGALSNDHTSPNQVENLTQQHDSPERNSQVSYYDPVMRSILSVGEAQTLIVMYFDHCHPLAPVLSQKWRHFWNDLRMSSPILFLEICCVSARFWNGNFLSNASTQFLHPKFDNLTSLLDEAVSRLLLKPAPSDVTLDSIRVLLLYAQWMPYDQNPQTNTNAPLKTRYNDISAWAVLGLAIRYAIFIGLDRSAISTFQGASESITEDDFSRLRVWQNLLTCDCNLMLTSGLPASLDPMPAASIGKVFATHPIAQQPGDLRVTALVELVVVAHRAMRNGGDFSSRQLDAVSLRKANSELDDWERTWEFRLRHTPSQHNQLPFNSVRWYRLALNSASLAPFLSPPTSEQQQSPQLWLLQSLDTSLTAATQILISLSEHGSRYVWQLESQSHSTFPDTTFDVDSAALSRLSFAVDSTWISHTFAVMFLVLCYVRGRVDDDLHICSVVQITSDQTCAPLPPRSHSLLGRLLQLAVKIFDGVCQITTSPSARDFRIIVHNATSLVLSPKNADAQDGLEMDDAAMQSLFDLFNNSGQDWAGNLLNIGTDNAGWATDESLQF